MAGRLGAWGESEARVKRVVRGQDERRLAGGRVQAAQKQVGRRN